MALLASIVVVFCALAGAAILRPPTWPTFALTAYVLLLGEIVGLVEALSLARAVTSTYVLAAEGAIAVAVVAALRQCVTSARS